MNHIKALPGGQSEPHVFECEDRRLWVLKLPGNPQAFGLGRDMIGLSLATRLGVPVFEFSLIEVDDRALGTMDHRPAWARAGVALGTLWIEHAVNVAFPGQLAGIGNQSDLGSLVVLDLWVETLDRQRPDGVWNLLIRSDIKGTPFVAIDFGFSLQPSGPGEIQSPLIPSGYPAAIRSLASRDAVAAALHRLANLADQELVGSIAAVPEAWLNIEQRRAILEVLRTRRLLLLGSTPEEIVEVRMT